MKHGLKYGLHPDPLDLEWFAVLTRSRHERRVHDQLVQKDLEAFFPTTKRWSRWQDRRKLVEWPLFPGYCFVRTVRTHMLPILSCPGVSHVVTIGGKPASIPDYQIDAIRRLMESALKYDVWPQIAEGDLVRVTGGPLIGARGRFVRKGADFRLLLAVELLGRALSVQVSAADVEKI
jgi:transcriptional antiterminator NusG